MKIINSLENLIIDEKTVVALGNFDGIHAGHKVILEDAVNVALEEGVSALCFTFSNHPCNFIMNKDENDPEALKFICSEADKIKLIEKMGFDYLVNVPFDEKIMNMPAQKFFDEIILKTLNAQTVSVGFNYTYGANADGNAETLYLSGKESSIEVRVHDAVKVFHNVVSSTLIREALSEGNIEAVSMYLDREYSISDYVSDGMKKGHNVGYPTINFPASSNIIYPRNGVYASHTIFNGKEYKSITNIGVKPTVGGAEKTIETHILDFEGDLYDKKMNVVLEHFIRDEKNFSSIEELRKQISEDIKKII